VYPAEFDLGSSYGFPGAVSVKKAGCPHLAPSVGVVINFVNFSLITRQQLPTHIFSRYRDKSRNRAETVSAAGGIR
jgi:hypothetical protein